jgi:hypothetical protein
MPLIFVATDNSDPKNKLYDARKAGTSASAAEAAMQKVVKKVVGKAAGFTTLKSDQAKGYTIRLTISKLEVADRQTKCTLTGEIVRYPVTASRSKDASEGEHMVNIGEAWTGSGTATGTSEGSLLDLVEAIAESMVTRSIPAMKADFARR